jgi:replicative DNA helicase
MTTPRKSPFPAIPSLEHSKVPPNAIELEDAVLGACLLDSEALSEVSSILRPEMFYKLEHQMVFSAMMSLESEGNPADILTVTQRLKKDGNLSVVGGAHFVSTLTDRVGSGANAEYHARIIAQKFIARELIRVSGDIYARAFDDTEDPIELLDRANDEVASIGSDVVGDGRKSKDEIFNSIVANMERVASGNGILGLSSGILSVDRLSAGLQKGHFDILAARPGMGKTTRALSIVYHVGVILQKHVRIYSIEMTDEELTMLLVSMKTQIDSLDLKKGKLTTEQWSAFHEARAIITNSPIEIIDNLKEWPHIKRDATKANRKKPVELIVIDYIQIMSYPGVKGSREQEISQMSQGMKQLAKDLGTPVLALSQLSRDLEKRGGAKRPMLSDLRESGSLEQDADSVTFLYRPEYYGIEFSDEGNLPTAGLCEVIIAKNRGGLTGTVPVRVNLATSTFEDYDGGSFKAPSPPPIEEVQRWSPMPRSSEFDDQFDGPF